MIFVREGDQRFQHVEVEINVLVHTQWDSP